jgi:FkbM family methyltransferase
MYRALRGLADRNPGLLNMYRALRAWIDDRRGLRHPLQKIRNIDVQGLTRLGTDYGGWTFVDNQSLYGATIISAGLGEDASFDIEICRKYNAKVIIVDPTPRSIDHYQDIVRNIGKARTVPYRDGGKESVDSYDLTGIDAGQLVLEASALWTTPGRVRFYKPADHAHVSHSIVNYQNEYRTDTAFIEVSAITLEMLIDKHSIARNEIRMLKLDIEGAELELLESMLEAGIFPDQLLIEYDDLNAPVIRKERFEKITRVNTKILSSGYQLIYCKPILGTSIGVSDFLYVKKELIK